MKTILFLFITMNILAKDVILLLGGINRFNARYMNKIKEALSQEEREIIDDIVKDTESLNSTIAEKATDVYEALKNKGITAQDRIIIIGHSRGGLVGYELYKKYKDKLRIVALFTISTPWRGASILEKIATISKWLNGIEIIFNKKSKYHIDLKEEIFKNIKLNEEGFENLLSSLSSIKTFLKDIENKVAIQELKVNSEFMKDLNKEGDLLNCINTINEILKRSQNSSLFNSDIKSLIALPIFNIIGNKIIFDDYFPLEKLIESINKLQNILDKASTVTNIVSGGSVLTGTIITAATVPLLGPFAFLFLGLGLATPIAASNIEVNSLKNEDEIIYDLRYLLAAIDYIKKLPSKNENDHDFILNIQEQSLPENLENFQKEINFRKTYNERVIYIENAFHGTIENQSNLKNEFQEKINRNAIYNKDQTIEFILKNINEILKEN